MVPSLTHSSLMALLMSRRVGQFWWPSILTHSAFFGGEHVLSLFFASLSKIKPIKLLILKMCRLYNVFGSGAHHAILLGKAITPQMVALGASPMCATPPIPIFSGSVPTSIKGAAIIHHDGGWQTMWMCPCFWVRSALGSPNIVKKRCTCAQVQALVNDRFGARENMTKRRT